MNKTTLFLTLAGLIAVAFVAVRNLARKLARSSFPLANDNPLTVGEHLGAQLTGYHDSAPVTTRFLLVVQGSADNHYALPTSTIQQPIAVCYDEPAATTDPVEFIALCGNNKTLKMVAAGTITASTPVVTNGDGKVKALPSAVGSYWCVGFAITSTANSGDLVEVAPTLFPISVGTIT